jgi:DNA repair protein RecO (recombination protein O)
MSRTYKATGINLKSMPLGEADRLVTVLTQEYGLIRAVAPGARKQNSSLGGRSSLFVVNELLIAKGRSLDKITQAETITTYPRLSRDLGKLAACQYMAEIVMCQALSEQPQAELFCLLNEHLKRLEQLPSNAEFLILAHLCQAVFHFLTLAGITPQVQQCQLTSQFIIPEIGDREQVGFSIAAGGIISLNAWERLRAETKATIYPRAEKATANLVKEKTDAKYRPDLALPQLNARFSSQELALMQQLADTELSQVEQSNPSWLSIEKILRQYVEYHFDRPIRSAALIDSYFALPFVPQV